MADRLQVERDPQVVLTLIRICGGFCCFNDLSRAIPTPLACDALQMFDADVHQCFLNCMAITTTDAS